MTQVFSLGVPDDLILPQKGSMTARALVSYGQRSLFEQRASLLLPELRGTAEHLAIATWLEIVEGMLPGNPHAVARSLRDPKVHVPARRLLARERDLFAEARAFSVSALLWLEVEQALPRALTLGFAEQAYALGHGVRSLVAIDSFGATPLERIPALEGRILALSYGEPMPESRVTSLRRALAHVARVAPAQRDDLDRVVAAFVLGARPETRLPLGMAFVAEDADLEADVRAILDAVVTEKLALVRLADEVAEPFAPLREIAVDFACAAALGTRPSADLDAWRSGARLTPTGEGISRELAQKYERSP